MISTVSSRLVALLLFVSGLLLASTACADDGKTSKNGGGQTPPPPPTSTTAQSPAPPPPVVGATFGGGIVVFVDRSGHGVIAAPVDQGYLTWFNAAAACTGYHGGSFTDWRLPSRDELHYLYLQKAVVPGVSNNIGYWCSQSKDANYAYMHYFLNSGMQMFDMKVYKHHVRAVRSF